MANNRVKDKNKIVGIIRKFPAFMMVVQRA